MHVNLDELKNIIGEIQPPPLLSPEEYGEMVETAGLLVHALIREDPMIVIHPSFEDVVHYDTAEVLTHQLQPIFEFDIDEYVETAVLEAMKIFHTYICPRRSYYPTFIR